MHSASPAPRYLRPLISLGVVLALLAGAPAHADSVDELRALVDARDAAAWDMAQRMEPENAGDPEFDFWYGLAAKAAGQKNHAVFAFERVLINQPDNARAKLELADAYAAHGNTAEARRLFEEVLASTPPAPVQERIRNYLGALQNVDGQRKTRVDSFVTVAGGYDSNISSATDDATQLGFLLSPQSVGRDAGFIDVQAGVDVVQPVSQRDFRFLSASAQRRDNDEVFSGGDFDYSQITATGGWMMRRGSASWRVPLTVQALWAESDSAPAVVVNDDRYVFMGALEYSRALSARTAVNWFGQAGNIHYPSEESRNAWLLSGGGAYVWQAASSPLRLTSILRVGTEPAEESDFEFNGRDYVAARLNARWTLSPTQSLYGAVGVQHTEYQGDQPVLGYARQEFLLDGSFGWQWQASEVWRFNADLSYADNDSRRNSLYDYDRTQVKFSATRRF